MTTEQQPAVPPVLGTLPPSLRNETREETRRLERQALKNMEFCDKIFDDLLRDHYGKYLMIYGDQQFVIADNLVKLEAALSEEDRKHAMLFAIVPPITDPGARYAISRLG